MNGGQMNFLNRCYPIRTLTGIILIILCSCSYSYRFEFTGKIQNCMPIGKFNVILLNSQGSIISNEYYTVKTRADGFFDVDGYVVNELIKTVKFMCDTNNVDSAEVLQVRDTYQMNLYSSGRSYIAKKEHTEQGRLKFFFAGIEI